MVRFSAIATATTTFVWIIAMWWASAPTLAIAAAISCFGAVAAIFLLRSKYVNLTAHVLSISGLAGLFLASLLIHPTANFNMLMVAIIANSFLYFQTRERFKYTFYYGFLTLALWVASNIFSGDLPTGYEIGRDIAETYIQPFVAVSLFALLSLQSGFFAYIVIQRTERLREETQRAKSADRAKSNFLATMSHEIRTPMNGVVGMVELLLRSDIQGRDREMLFTVRESSFSLLRIIDDILDSAKIDAGKMTLTEELTDLPALIRGVHGTLLPVAQTQQLGVELNIDDNVPQWVMCDAGRVRQIILNILGNAIKFSDHSDGHIPKPVEVSVSYPDRTAIVIRVRDHGIGMEPELVKGLFKPFVQSEDTENRRFGGTGLGLSIAKRLIDMIGGKLEVSSERHKGSTFTITLHLEPAEAPETHPTKMAAAADDAGLSTERRFEKKILIVEDNAINRMVIEAQLGSLGYRSEIAEQGEEGLRKWQGGGFDLVLTDCQMPVMNGFDMARAIRTEEGQKTDPRTPIIAITANALSGEAEKCTDAGMDGYLAKPVRLENLRDVLDQHLGLLTTH